MGLAASRVSEATGSETAMAWGVPSLEDARQVGEGFVALGAAQVLAFGSVARGEAADGSDIDLVAVFDDLGDYRCRPDLHRRLVAKASELCDFGVDVWVTDRAEWARRTTKVSASLEAAIADGAVVVADARADRQADVDWGKEIGMPPDNRAEALSRLGDASNALGEVEERLDEGTRELRAAAAGATRRHDKARYERMASICFHSQKTIESALKTVVCLVGGRPERIHDLDRLAAKIPVQYRDVTWPAMDPSNRATPEEISLWHRAGPYSDQRPQLTLAQIEATAAELARIACDTAEALARHFETADDSRTLADDLFDTIQAVRDGLEASDIALAAQHDLPRPNLPGDASLDL